MAAVDPLERLTNLVALLLETPRPLSIDDIADALVGQYPDDRTARRGAFERDKRLLRDEGVPIELTPGDKGGTRYHIDKERYELPDLGLTEDEAQALALAVATINLGTTAGSHALAKLDATEPGGGPIAMLGASDVLPSLFAAQTARASVTFSYRDVTRTVDPYGLLARDGFWYLIGHDHASDAQRTYRLDRFDGADISVGPPATFELPKGFDPSAALPADPKLLGDDDVVVAEIRVDGARASAVITELGSESVSARHYDGSVIVRVPVRNRVALRSWVLGLGEHAVVLGPPVLRDDIVAWLKALAGE